MILDLVRHAKQLLFNNANSELSATNVQDAIDEVDGKIGTLNSSLTPTTVNDYTLLNGATLVEEQSVIFKNDYCVDVNLRFNKASGNHSALLQLPSDCIPSKIQALTCNQLDGTPRTARVDTSGQICFYNSSGGNVTSEQADIFIRGTIYI